VLTRLIQAGLGNRNWVFAITGILVFLGALSVANLPIDAVPDITNVQVVVNTKTGALDPEKIEVLVTRPIEVEMAGLPGLEEVRSISKYGLSQVTLVFADDTDIYWARQQVAERIQNSKKDIPEKVSPELAPITTGLGEVYMYAVEAKPGSKLAALPEEARLTELRTIQDFVIRPTLRRTKGIADVDSNGGYKKEIHVNFFPDRLERVGLSVEQLTRRLETLGENFGGGYIQKEGQQIIVRTTPGFDNLADLERIPLGLDVRGRPIHLKEVAEVREDHSLRLGAATRDGHETVLGTVLMRMGANSREVAKESDEVLRALELPEGVQAVPLYSRSFLVDATIGTVSRSLLEGAVLVVAVLLLLLGNVRAALIVACAIPISMLMAVRGMIWLGISGNLMSLGAIDFGLLVDGSVVLIESVIRRFHEKAKGAGVDKRTLVLEASSEVVRPVVFGLLMIMVVYVPILTLQGIEGKMFRPMAATVLLALFASLLVAVFLMPALADAFIKQPSASGSHDDETKLFKIIKRAYLPALEYFLRKPMHIIGPSIALLVIGFVLLLRMGSDFIPKLDEGDMVMGLMRNSKIGITASVSEQKKAEEVIRKYPEVETVFARIGTPESATDPMGVNLADTFLILKKDHSKWKHESKSDLFEAIRKDLLAINQDQDVSETQPIEMRFNEILEGSRADVTLRIFGLDLQKLVTEIDSAKAILEKISGVESVSFDALTALKTGPMLDLIPIYDSQARYGITLAELNNLVETAMGGREVGSYIEAGRRFPIMVHLDESLREKIEAIEKLPVGLPHGGTLPLSKLVKLDLKDRVTTIARSWGERYAAVSINLKDRDISSFVKEAQEKVGKGLTLTKDMRLYWGGQFKNLDRAQKRLFVIVPLTLGIVFLILLRSFGSLSDALLVFSSIPFAAVGGIYALAFRGMHFSVSAAVGFIALIGIALLNSLVLMNVLHQKHLSVTEAALSRLRPVMMTALVASFGFVPMALNTGIGAEVQKPLATVVIGGLMTSTLLTLILLPVLYLALQKRRSLNCN